MTVPDESTPDDGAIKEAPYQSPLPQFHPPLAAVVGRDWHRALAREAAEAEAGVASQRAKEALREHVAVLAVAGAERILRKEINAQAHAELLTQLKSEL